MIYPNNPLYLLSLLGYIYYLTYYTLTTKDNIYFLLNSVSIYLSREDSHLYFTTNHPHNPEKISLIFSNLQTHHISSKTRTFNSRTQKDQFLSRGTDPSSYHSSLPFDLILYAFILLTEPPSCSSASKTLCLFPFSSSILENKIFIVSLAISSHGWRMVVNVG